MSYWLENPTQDLTLQLLIISGGNVVYMPLDLLVRFYGLLFRKAFGMWVIPRDSDPWRHLKHMEAAVELFGR